MSTDPQKSKVDNELENRLDSLFDEDGLEDSGGKAEVHSNDPLDELKSLVMSIEWEITDDVMERFINQIESVKTRFGEDRILVMFLQLLGSLGLYVKTNKGKAHPSSFKLLNSVYASFERAAASGKISPSEKKKLLYVELNKYKELKEKIETNREPEPEPMRTYGTSPETLAGSAEKNRVTAAEVQSTGDRNENDTTVTRQYINEVVANLKAEIVKELSAIREDITRLIKSN